MNCLMSLSETARHGGAGLLLSEAGPNLFPVTGRDALGGDSASRIVLVGIGGGIAMPFMYFAFHGEHI
jgi:hypothetical protein